METEAEKASRRARGLEFRARLGRLYTEFGLKVTSCGCCGEWIEGLASYETGTKEAASLRVMDLYDPDHHGVDRVLLEAEDA